MLIQDYINDKIDGNVHTQNYHIGKELGISSAMLSHYRNGHTKHPSLAVAQRIYKLDHIAIYPYSLEACSEGAENE